MRGRVWAPDFYLYQLGDWDNPYSFLSLSFLKPKVRIIMISIFWVRCSALYWYILNTG